MAPCQGITDRGNAGRRLPDRTVVLTYDDGPDEHTLDIARYLASQRIHATFFVNGRRFCERFDAQGGCAEQMDTRPCDNHHSQAPVAHPKYYPESLLDELIALGHRVGNHTEDHCNLPFQTSAQDVAYELETTQELIERHILPGEPVLFRPPYGGWNARTAAEVRADPALGDLVGPVFWAIGGGDWACWPEGDTVDTCGQRYLDSLDANPHRNGILLMHDRPEFNVGSNAPLLLTEWLVPRLLAKGCRFARIEDVPGLGVSASGCALPDEANDEPPIGSMTSIDIDE